MSLEVRETMLWKLDGLGEYDARRPLTGTGTNLLGLVVFAVLFWLTMRWGVTDPVCGMKVDRGKALTAEHDGHTFHFCSQHCRERFEADPDAPGARSGLALSVDEHT